MILWFTFVVIAVATLSAILCMVLGFVGRRPSDLTVGAMALIELFLIAQLVIAIVAPFAGNPPTGSLLEFWVYLIAVILVPPAGVAWALTDRTSWSTVVMGTAALAVAVMMWRMQSIWTLQPA